MDEHVLTMHWTHILGFLMQTCLGHAKYFFRFSSPPTPVKYKQIKKNGVEGFPSNPVFLFAEKKMFEKGR